MGHTDSKGQEVVEDVTLEEIMELFKGSTFLTRQLVIISDSCYSGAWTDKIWDYHDKQAGFENNLDDLGQEMNQQLIEEFTKHILNDKTYNLEKLKEFWERQIDIFIHHHTLPERFSSVTVYASCQANEECTDTSEGGDYTRKLLGDLEEENFKLPFTPVTGVARMFK